MIVAMNLEPEHMFILSICFNIYPRFFSLLSFVRFSNWLIFILWIWVGIFFIVLLLKYFLHSRWSSWFDPMLGFYAQLANWNCADFHYFLLDKQPRSYVDICSFCTYTNRRTLTFSNIWDCIGLRGKSWKQTKNIC